MLGMLGLGALAAAPWLAKAAPAIGRGAQTMWNLGKGMGTPLGRRQAGRAVWQQPGTIPRNPTTNRFEAGSRQPGAVNRAADWYGQQSKLRQAGMNVGAGLGAMALWPEPGQEMPEEAGGPGVGMPYPPGGGGVSAAAGPTSGLPLHSERLQKNRDKFLNNMSLIMKHSMLLQFQNPGKENTYMKDAIQLLKMDALSRNSVEDAKIVESVFKDGKMPKRAKTIYDRLVPHLGPKKAAEVSGYTLEIEKTEAEAAADYARSQPKLTDMYSKDAVMMMQLQEAYSSNPQGAIQQLAMFLKTKVIEMPEQYTQFKPKTDSDYYQLAASILSGAGTTGAPSPTGDVYDIKVK
tara:strand:- start:3592 stop:4635 length:1044 start_codon:yes stop_codon:yes gene_type:complete